MRIAGDPGVRVLVLGASGRIGRHLVKQSLERGHGVTVIVRDPGTINPKAKIIIDDVLRDGCFDGRVAGHDFVLSALGLNLSNPANPWSRNLSPPDLVSRVARSLTAAMKREGVDRVLSVSAAGASHSWERLSILMRLVLKTSKIGVAYRDHAIAQDVYLMSGLDWCCPQPTVLTDGPLTQKVAVVKKFGFSYRISRADVAWWMLERATKPIDDRTPIISSAK